MNHDHDHDERDHETPPEAPAYGSGGFGRDSFGPGFDASTDTSDHLEANVKPESIRVQRTR
jgi:hypothetical protein